MPDCRDPPGRSVRSGVILVANMYVHIYRSMWRRARSMYTYVQRPGCKKENTATYVYIRAGSRTPTCAYVRPGLVYMAGSERRNNIVVFMGRQRNPRVHGEATKCVVFMGRQRN